MLLSYFPPTNEEMAMAQLGASPKEVKKLKKKGILKYQGRLICNISIDEYLKGGKGYNDALQLSLQKAIDESIVKKYAEQKILKNADIQLATLVEKGLIIVTFNNQQKSSLSNFSMIKKVEWTDKIQSEVESRVDVFYKEFIEFIAHKRNSDSFALYSIADFLISMKKLGAVNMCLNYIDELIEKKSLEYATALDEFNAFDSSERSTLERLIVIKKELIKNDFLIKGKIGVEKHNAENEALRSEYAIIAQDNVDRFSSYAELLVNLEIKYELGLLTQLKNKLSYKAPYGYDNFVEDFKIKTFEVNNQLVSLDEITVAVNSTRAHFKKESLTSDEAIISELKETISWDFRTH